ncbi:MAG TPA: hypothetical protein VID03_02595 [Acidimicrobiia bacterium]|jgi:hypothetical protein
MTSVFRYRPTVRKGSRLMKASLSPGGIAATAGLVGAGLLLGLPAVFVAGAGVVGFLTSAVLHLRDPKLAASLMAPEFDRDLSALDQEHLPLMLGALQARDRLDLAISDWQGAEMEGVKTRVTQTCRRMYDSVLWLQRADQFLGSVDEDALVRRLYAASPGPVKDELEAQRDELQKIRKRRDEAADRIGTITTGIDTLAVKANAIALDTSDPDEPVEEVRSLRKELDAFTAGLDEVDQHLAELVPPEATPA